MDNELYEKISGGGAFSLPYLIRLYPPNEEIYIRLINDTDSFVWQEADGGDDETYIASAFTYTPSDEGATFDVTVIDNDLLELLDGKYASDGDDTFIAEFVGVLMENGKVQKISARQFRYGSAEWDGQTATISFDKDDRYNMTFPPLVFNGDNQRGN